MTFPSVPNTWKIDDVIAEALIDCPGGIATVTAIIVPTGAIMKLQGDWDLTTWSSLVTFTIVGNGSLDLGSKDLSLPSGSSLIIENTSNTLAFTGGNNNTTLNIGGASYPVGDFPAIIAAGGATESGLPIELVKLDSYTTERNEVKLIWETASEINNLHFEIEHSLNGIDFERIGIVEGKGTTNINQVYNYLHVNPSFGNNYYRLKQVDYDLEFEYFKIISQVVNDERGFQVKINSLNLLSIEMNQRGKMTVYNMMGQMVLEDKVSEGTNDFIFENLAPGNYTVNIFYSGNIERVKISR